MNYQRIRYFMKAAEILNFSEAARQMYIAPQSFGKQIALLETELGEKLFERTTRDMKLTPFGKLCYENFSGPIRAMERSFEQMCILGHGKQQAVRIGILGALSYPRVVSPLVEALRSKYPDGDISIRMMRMGELQTSIQNGTIDLGITLTHDREVGWQGCTTYSLASYPARIVVSQKHRWFSKDTISLEDMRDSDFVRMDLPQFSETDYWANIPCKRYIIVENDETLRLEMDRGQVFTIVTSELDETCERGYKAFALPCQPFLYTLALVFNNLVRDSFPEQVGAFIRTHFEAGDFKTEVY